MLIPSLGDISLLFAFIALILLLPTQIFFPFHDKDFFFDKKRFKNVSQIFGLIALIVLCVQAYLLVAT